MEIRYRQRYVDLIANPDLRKVFIQRAKVISAIRGYLDKNGYLEVETPMMHLIPEAWQAGRLRLTITNRIWICILGLPGIVSRRNFWSGFEKIYEINRSFRNEGVSTRHNPEFTMLRSIPLTATVQG